MSKLDGIKAGDRVTYGTGATDWELVAVRGDDAILYNRLRAIIVSFRDLRRA